MLQIDREAPKMHPMPFAANRFMTQLQPVLGPFLKYFFIQGSWIKLGYIYVHSTVADKVQMFWEANTILKKIFTR